MHVLYVLCACVCHIVNANRNNYCYVIFISDCDDGHICQRDTCFAKLKVIFDRNTFLISPDGEISYRWISVLPINHAKEVLNVLKKKI